MLRGADQGHACTQCASAGFIRRLVSPTTAAAVPVDVYTLSLLGCIDVETALVHIAEIEAQADSRMDVERNQLFGVCALALLVYGLLLVLDDLH